MLLKSGRAELWEEWEENSRTSRSDGDLYVNWATQWLEAMEKVSDRTYETFEAEAVRAAELVGGVNMYAGSEQICAVAAFVWKFGADLKKAYHKVRRIRIAIDAYEGSHRS
jgi:hypothetical protein